MKDLQKRVLEALRAEADRKVDQSGNALHFRKKNLKRISNNIRGAKAAIKACNRAGVSTRATQLMLVKWRSEVQECSVIMKTLKGWINEASNERYALDLTILEMSENRELH